MTLNLVEIASADGARAWISPYGGQVMSWIPAGETEDRLYHSPLSHGDGGAAIRGGVPVIFPQFADRGPLTKHGFARNMPWTPSSQDGSGKAEFLLRANETARQLWPHLFLASLGVSVAGKALEVTLTVQNEDATPFSFTAALHTYLSVSDVGAIKVDGLANTHFTDSTDNDRPDIGPNDSLTFTGEIDRVYRDAQWPLAVREANGRTISIAAEGFNDVVIWNPGTTVAAQIPDLPDVGYREFVCVEPAEVMQPIVLQPGENWKGRQVLTAV